MPWVRVGDTSATHPVVMRAATVAGADERSINELYGFAVRLSTQSAGHMTDYVVELGTVELIGGSETRRLVAQAVEAGYLTPTTVEGRPAWRIVDDPDVIHMRLREEVMWDRQRKRDNANPDVTLAVVRRDGSACRYCGRSVDWNDRRGGRGATYDHRTPGKAVTSPDDQVVACRSCNSSRGRDPAVFDEAHPLRKPPAEPYYCDHARARLEKNGITVPARAADPAPRQSRTGGSQPPATGTRDVRPATGHADPAPRSQSRPDADQAPVPGSRDGRPAHGTPDQGGNRTANIPAPEVNSARDGPADLAEGTEAGYPGSGRDGSEVGRRRRRGRRRPTRG